MVDPIQNAVCVVLELSCQTADPLRGILNDLVALDRQRQNKSAPTRYDHGDAEQRCRLQQGAQPIRRPQALRCAALEESASQCLDKMLHVS